MIESSRFLSNVKVKVNTEENPAYDVSLGLVKVNTEENPAYDMSLGLTHQSSANNQASFVSTVNVAYEVVDIK